MIFAITLLSLYRLHGQSPITLSGVISDSTNSGLEQATIRLSSNKDTLRLLSGTNGHFSALLPNAPAEWDILVSMQGYRSYRSHIRIQPNIKPFSLPPILLHPEYQTLATVIVHRQQPLTIKTDTLEYHASAYALRDGSMLGDLLKRLPGIRLGPDSSVNVMGKKISKILVDGKKYFGGDIQNALSNLPYDIIDKIEVIDDYGDLARLTGVKTGQPEKVINIVLRQDRRFGQFGNIAGGPGTIDQYAATGIINFLDGDRKTGVAGAATNDNPLGKAHTESLALNYSDSWGSKWSTTSDAAISANNHSSQNSLTQSSYFTNGNSNSTQNTTAQGTNTHQILNNEWLYIPNADNKLRINTSLSNQSEIQSSQSTLLCNQSDSGSVKMISSSTQNKLTIPGVTAESKFYFAHASPYSGQSLDLGLNIKYTFAAQKGNNSTQSLVNADSLTTQTDQIYRLNNVANTWDIKVNWNYYLPLGAKSSLYNRCSFDQTITQNNKSWQQPRGNVPDWVVVDSLSNNYTFKTLLQEINNGYIYHAAKIQFNAGINLSPSNLNGISPGKENKISLHYLNLFPIASLDYFPSKSQRLSISYSTSINFPSLQQIEPVTDITNPQYPITGNPYLKPASTQSFNFGYNFNSIRPTNYYGFGIGVGYDRIEDQIVPNIVHSKDSGIVIQQTYFVNINGNYDLKADWHLDMPALLENQIKISVWGDIKESHNISLADYIPFVTNTSYSAEYLNIQYLVPDLLEANLFATYTYSLTRTPGNSDQPIQTTSFIWGMRNRHFILKTWVLQYEFKEIFTGAEGQSFSLGPTLLNIHLKRSFLRKKQLTCILSGTNLLNANAALAQIVTANPTIVTQSRSTLVGRSFFLALQWNFERFSHPLIR